MSKTTTSKSKIVKTKKQNTPRETAEQKQARAKTILKKLYELYPDAECALIHRNAFELLIATILSAQCTDVRVNMVTPGLFTKYPTPQKMMLATPEEIEAIIRSTGFYRNKAKSILGASKMLVEKFGGKVPEEMEDLLQLPGVARKTANVVLGTAMKKNVGVVVDTHVSRLTQRMGLTKETTPEKIERDLMGLVEQKSWTDLSHLLIHHGRKICAARKPLCDTCGVREWCCRVGV